MCGANVAAHDVAVVGQRRRLKVKVALGEPGVELGGQGAVGGELGASERREQLPFTFEGRVLGEVAALLLLPPLAVRPRRQVDDVEPACLALCELVAEDGRGRPPWSQRDAWVQP